MGTPENSLSFYSNKMLVPLIQAPICTHELCACSFPKITSPENVLFMCVRAYYEKFAYPIFNGSIGQHDFRSCMKIPR